ncbi:PTS system ascorbate-specific IIA component [Enterococcus sp. PF1-24]|uniref:PTS sugar transporter subunit IIA n=1 Tax=unclassified Enterococcus TaxID=2608891 RepID=UPI002476BD3E|nr:MULTISPECIES: PTS sugar transporter subunit IIA [unclassified Enterococcus]MDH6365584.1 PTS system ascorbate-specific IIA component [Enterococcus sp. PFB1-1]MDH6402700.1 PTS system ascorbate-specific IIA component [Enterococcus sp. PF1-24]
MLSEVISSENILLDVEVTSFEEAIEKSLQPFLEQKIVKQSYINSVLQIYHETGPYIVITKHVAMPHAPIDDGALKLAIGFTRLKEPVISGNKLNDPVKFLFPLSTTDTQSHLDLLSELAELLSDKEFLEFLSQVQSSEQLINFLKEKEGVKKNA